jgi:hypothetical protein
MRVSFLVFPVFLAFGCCQAAFECDTSNNFMLELPYRQIALTDYCNSAGVCNNNPKYGTTNDNALALAYCQDRCATDISCTGLFFQQHNNGHEICGFYSSSLAPHVRVHHGHKAGQICEKLSPAAVMESTCTSTSSALSSAIAAGACDNPSGGWRLPESCSVTCLSLIKNWLCAVEASLVLSAPAGTPCYEQDPSQWWTYVIGACITNSSDGRMNSTFTSTCPTSTPDSDSPTKAPTNAPPNVPTNGSHPPLPTLMPTWYGTDEPTTAPTAPSPAPTITSTNPGDTPAPSTNQPTQAPSITPFKAPTKASSPPPTPAPTSLPTLAYNDTLVIVQAPSVAVTVSERTQCSN